MGAAAGVPEPPPSVATVDAPIVMTVGDMQFEFVDGNWTIQGGLCCLVAVLLSHTNDTMVVVFVCSHFNWIEGETTHKGMRQTRMPGETASIGRKTVEGHGLQNMFSLSLPLTLAFHVSSITACRRVCAPRRITS